MFILSWNTNKNFTAFKIGMLKLKFAEIFGTTTQFFDTFLVHKCAVVHPIKRFFSDGHSIHRSFDIISNINWTKSSYISSIACWWHKFCFTRSIFIFWFEKFKLKTRLSNFVRHFKIFKFLSRILTHSQKRGS